MYHDTEDQKSTSLNLSTSEMEKIFRCNDKLYIERTQQSEREWEANKSVGVRVVDWG